MRRHYKVAAHRNVNPDMTLSRKLSGREGERQWRNLRQQKIVAKTKIDRIDIRVVAEEVLLSQERRDGDRLIVSDGQSESTSNLGSRNYAHMLFLLSHEETVIFNRLQDPKLNTRADFTVGSDRLGILTGDILDQR